MLNSVYSVTTTTLTMVQVYVTIFTLLTLLVLTLQSDSLENLRNLSAWPGRLRYYFGQIRAGLAVAVGAALATAVLFAVSALFRHELRVSRSDWRFLVLLLPVIPTVFVPALISPVLEGRYIYNVMPICVLAPGFFLALYGRYVDVRRWCAVCAVLAVVWSLRSVPDYIYEEHREYNALVQAHADSPCVYVCR